MSKESIKNRVSALRIMSENLNGQKTRFINGHLDNILKKLKYIGNDKPRQKQEEPEQPLNTYTCNVYFCGTIIGADIVMEDNAVNAMAQMNRNLGNKADNKDWHIGDFLRVA